jgi:hypothetical protein
MKPTVLDFNKLESSVILGDYQGFKSHGGDCKFMDALQNGQRNRKALFRDLRKVFARELGIYSESDLSPRQKEYINRILNLKLNETNQLKLESSRTRQLAFVRAVRNYVSQGKFFYFMFEKELKDLFFRGIC